MTSMNRRSFLKNLTACSCGAMAWGVVPGLNMQKALAAGTSDTKVLFINLNGGLDGLYALQPTGGELYSTLSSMRTTLKTDPSQLLATDGRFGLHPNLGFMKTLYDEGKLSAVLNVGYKNMSRSHEEAEVAFARGVPDRLAGSAGGFINRMGDTFGWDSMRAVCLSGSDRSFEGSGYRGTQVWGLEDFYFHGDPSVGWTENNYRTDMLYSLSQDLQTTPGNKFEDDVKANTGILVNNSAIVRDAIDRTTFATPYPRTYFGWQFQDADILFSNPSLGSQVAYMRRGGFDTHSDQKATLDRLLQEFNQGLSAFVSNMKAKNIWNNLIVVVLSEFGRTNSENGSAGTDHGGAITMFLTGGAIRGGIYGETTVADIRDNGWLPMRYNVVEVYRRVLEKMGYDPNMVFAASDGPSLSGLFT